MWHAAQRIPKIFYINNAQKLKLTLVRNCFYKPYKQDTSKIDLDRFETFSFSSNDLQHAKNEVYVIISIKFYLKINKNELILVKFCGMENIVNGLNISKIN